MTTKLKPREEAMNVVRTHPIKAIFGSEVESFAYEKLNRTERRAYCDEAKRITSSHVIENELKKMYDDLRHKALIEVLSYEELLLLRHQYQGVTDFLERIRAIVYTSDKKETRDDIYSEL